MINKTEKQYSFTQEEWQKIAGVPYLLFMLFASGGNAKQNTVLQVDLENWENHEDPVYRSICKDLFQDNSFSTLVRNSMPGPGENQNASKIYEETMLTAQKALHRELKKGAIDDFAAHVSFLVYKIAYFSDSRDLFFGGGAMDVLSSTMNILCDGNPDDAMKKMKTLIDKANLK